MRALRWSFILLQVLWLNVVLPGHTRGVITLPGTDCADDRGVASVAQQQSDAHACCHGAAKSTRNDRTPTPRQRGACAVCFFAAHMAPPAPVVCGLLPLGLLEQIALPAQPAAVSIDRPLICLERGPPAA